MAANRRRRSVNFCPFGSTARLHFYKSFKQKYAAVQHADRSCFHLFVWSSASFHVSEWIWGFSCCRKSSGQIQDDSRLDFSKEVDMRTSSQGHWYSDEAKYCVQHNSSRGAESEQRQSVPPKAFQTRTRKQRLYLDICSGAYRRRSSEWLGTALHSIHSLGRRKRCQIQVQVCFDLQGSILASLTTQS